MDENTLVMLFEHNNWANAEIIRACVALPDELLDAEPGSATAGSIRVTLIHLVASQGGYLSLLTQPVEDRRDPTPVFADLLKSAEKSGQGLLALAKGEQNPLKPARIPTRNGYLVDPWVVMLQVINHATEHREQIKSMLTALEITPPDLDGWVFGEVAGALIKNSE